MDSSKHLTIEQARALLARVGVDVPANMPPQTVFSSLNGLLNGVPEPLLAAAANPGTEIRFAGQVGVTVPPQSPLNYQFNIGVEGKAKLSDVEMGTGFDQTQTFKASVQLQREDRYALEKTLINRLYNWSKYADHLPGDAKKWLDSTPFQEWKDKIDKHPVLKTLAKGPPVSIAHTEFEGSRLTYEAVVTPDQGRRIAAGDKSAMPNPLDPLSMQPGNSVLMRGQDLKGSSTDIAYKFGLIGGSDTRLDGSGFGVRRLEGSIVEVYSGPISTIENSTYLGLGKRNLASLRFEAENGIEQRQLSVARLDLSTPEGQAAYKQFLDRGQVPDKMAPGITQVGYAQEITIEQARKLGLQVGSMGISIDNSTNNLITVSNLNGGKQEVKFNYSREGQVASESVYPMGADGKIDFNNGRYKLVLPSLDENATAGLRGAFGGLDNTRGLDHKQAVQLSFDAQQLMELRERSRALIASKPGGKELLANLDAGKPVGEIGDPLVQIAGAKRPVDVFGVLQNRPEHVASAISRLDLGVSADQRKPMPGMLDIQPPASMRAQMERSTDLERNALMDQFYRVPPSTDARRRADAADLPGAAPTTFAKSEAAPRMPTLTSPDHPDHQLFAALKGKAPPGLSDEQLAMMTLQTKQAGIASSRVEQILADPNQPDQLWVIGSVPGFRAKIDLSQPAPPLEQTSAALIAQTPPAEQQQRQSQPRAAMQQ